MARVWEGENTTQVNVTHQDYATAGSYISSCEVFHFCSGYVVRKGQENRHLSGCSNRSFNKAAGSLGNEAYVVQYVELSKRRRTQLRTCLSSLD